MAQFSARPPIDAPRGGNKLRDRTPKQIKELLHAAPFVPFTIVLANGKTYQVGNPDVLNVTMQNQILHEDVVGPATFINPILITRVITEQQVACA